MAGLPEPDWRSSRAVSSLIDLVVVLGILALLVVAFAPPIGRCGYDANRVADQKQLSDHYAIIHRYRQQYGHYPRGGGSRFILDPWVKGVVEHSDRSCDRYFNPAIRNADPHYLELRRRGLERLWPDLESVTSRDTHYAGRAEVFKRTMEAREAAWMADDNEDVWAFQDGTIHVLWGDGRVTALLYEEHLEQYGYPLDGPPLPVGPDSPVPALQKLGR